MITAANRFIRWNSVRLALLGLATLGLVGNITWIARHRRGLPFDIDEAGYLQRAFRNSDALHLHGIAGFIRTLRSPDPQAPMLTAVGGLIHAVTGGGPYRLLLVPQLFHLVLLGATYLLARRLVGPAWSLLAVALVGWAPGVISASRQFEFALTLTALITLTLAAQVRTRSFAALPMSVIWGALLGLTTLTRTQSLGLVPGLVLGALLSLFSTRPSGVQLRNAALGLVTAFGCSWWWYSASWHNVLAYLTDYGYGPAAAAYGPSYPLWSPTRWLYRFNGLAQSGLLLPLALALCLAVGIVVVDRLTRRERAHYEAGWARRVRASFASDHIQLAVFVAWAYLALSSTRNTGSSFVLPLLPAAVVLVIHALARVRPVGRRVGAACCAAAVLIGAASAFGATGVPSYSSISIGRLHIAVTDTRGALQSYTNAFAGGCPSVTMCMPTDPSSSATAQLARWTQPPQLAATQLHDAAAKHDRAPVVFFAVQDPFFNTNTVGLSYQLAYHAQLPIGLLATEAAATVPALVARLKDPRFGRPNLVIAGPASEVASARTWAPQTDQKLVVQALQIVGFSEISQVPLPDGRTMQIWWRSK